MHQTPDQAPSAPHPSRRRIALHGVALLATAVLGLGACGSDPASDSLPAASPSSSSAAPSSDPSTPASAPAAPTDAQNAGDVFTDAPTIAQVFVQQALGDAAVVNSPTISDAVDKTSAFLSDDIANDLISKGNTEDGFHVIPFKIAGLADGQPVTQADVSITSAGIMQTTPEFTQVRVVADYTWYFGEQGWLKGTRTYEIVLRPATETGGFAWQVTGMTGSDVPWTLGD